jgi:3-oxoadipate CoA-transferase alpha subunit
VVKDGATVMVGGFGGAGQPGELIDALIEYGARDLPRCASVSARALRS